MENKYNENGGIGAYADNESRAFVQTYTHDEVSIEYVDEYGLPHTEYIRIRIGTNEGRQIVLLENGKFYMIEGYQTSVSYREELSAKLLFEALDCYTDLRKTIGNLLELSVSHKTNLVDAINELTYAMATSRRVVSGIKYVSEKGVSVLDPDDLDVKYDARERRFAYWSAESNEWLPMPAEWARAKQLVIDDEHLPTDAAIGDTVAVIADNCTKRFNGEEWEEVHFKDYQVGDEILVQHVFRDDTPDGNAYGSIVLTESIGWYPYSITH